MESSAKRSASVLLPQSGHFGKHLPAPLLFRRIFRFLLARLPGPASSLPPAMRYMMLGTQAFMMCLSAFGIATGVGLLYLRKWARISILTWGGLSVFFGVIAFSSFF